MDENLSFRDLMARVRAGDAQAETVLVQRYEPIIQMVIRRRLNDSRLRQYLDSLDICQSVFLKFFPRVALGQYDLDTEEQLLKLLVTMALNRFRHYAEKYRGAARTIPAGREPVDASSGPLDQAALREVVQQVRDRLPAKDRQIMDLRAADHSWAEIGARFGDKADAVRMHYHRVVQQILDELGLQDTPA
jgi:RNA polymerase sigma factor (sigma-70 family)